MLFPYRTYSFVFKQCLSSELYKQLYVAIPREKYELASVYSRNEQFRILHVKKEVPKFEMFDIIRNILVGCKQAINHFC